jgi:branched-chain amino acid transport system ATP-binding protein
VKLRLGPLSAVASPAAKQDAAGAGSLRKEVGVTGLVLRDVCAGYAGVPAITNISLGCEPGEVLAVIGPNGAGKSTTLLAIAGALSITSGQVLLDGRTIGNSSADSVARAGVVLIPSDRGIFPGLTVDEHFRLSEHSPVQSSSPRGKLSRDQVLSQFPQLRQLTHRRAALLSGGEQQMLAIAKSLLLNPAVLMVDELSLGLAPKLVADLLPAIARIAQERLMSVIIVEQHYELALKVATNGLVMNRGRVILSATAPELINNPEILEAAYFGEEENSGRRH